MRPQIVGASGVSTSPVLVVTPSISPFNIGFGVKITGSITYTVQHTFDNPLDPAFNPSTATWYNHAYVVNQTVNADGNYAYPVQAVRLNITAGIGTGTLTLIQAGIAGI